MKKNLVIANFKMKLSSQSEIDNWIRNFSKAIEGGKIKETEIILGAPFLFFTGFLKFIKKEEFNLGAQNCFWEDSGAYTGEVSPKMLKSVGIEYVILGHSERRKYFGENNEQVALKLEKVLKNRMTPVVCVGETKNERGNGRTMQVVMKQLTEILKNVGRGNIEKTVICYEPVWAISANNPDNPPTANEIMEARLLIKKFLVEKYGKITAERVKIIYGGSVDQNNVRETCLDSGMMGALVGSCSVKPYDFVKLIQKFEEK